MLELKDRLDLAFKFLFLIVFTYGVICLTTCKSSCNTKCSSPVVSQCCKSNASVEKPCGAK